MVEGTRSICVSLHAYPISKCSYEGGYAEKYNGADLVTDSLNTVVVVVIQYRLGAFGMPLRSEAHIISFVSLIPALGFLSGDEIKAQGALNAGLREREKASSYCRPY